MRGQRIELRIGGTGGQGLILSAKILADALAAGGKRVAQTQSYEPTSRGGFCSADLVVADGEVDFPLATALDCLVLLDRMAVKPSWPLLKPRALVIADTRLCPELPAGDYQIHHLPLSRTALQLGSERVTNIVALGALAALSGIGDRNRLEQAVRAETPRGFFDLNMDALKAGYSLHTNADVRDEMAGAVGA
jgi:2-oxoglutarate ferredoxin oxidoreductase subunit gamma